jgi:hypothetical protein
MAGVRTSDGSSRVPGGAVRGPLVQRIACWSARHSRTAVVGWFGLVGAALLAGHLAGTQSRPQYDPGQAGQGEQVLHQLNVVTAPAESVLVQPRGPGTADLSFAGDPRMQQAVGQVVVALRALPWAAEDIRSPGPAQVRPRGGKNASSALVSRMSHAGGDAKGLVSASGDSALVRPPIRTCSSLRRVMPAPTRRETLCLRPTSARQNDHSAWRSASTTCCSNCAVSARSGQQDARPERHCGPRRLLRDGRS